MIVKKVTKTIPTDCEKIVKDERRCASVRFIPRVLFISWIYFSSCPTTYSVSNDVILCSVLISQSEFLLNCVDRFANVEVMLSALNCNSSPH